MIENKAMNATVDPGLFWTSALKQNEVFCSKLCLEQIFFELRSE
jgi:hypothetical protein